MKSKSYWRSFVFGAVVLALSACAPGQKFIETGNDLVAKGDMEGAVSQLEKAVKVEPNNYAYREQLVRMRTAYENDLLAQADRLRSDDRFDEAAELYNRVIESDPGNPRAHDALDQLAGDRRHKSQVDSARKAFRLGKFDEAGEKLRLVLAEDPANRGALMLRHQIEEADPQRGIPVGLRQGLRHQVSLEFRDADIKSVFEALSRSTGVNFVFDREIKPDLKVTVFLQNTTVEDAINVLTITNQLDKKYLNNNTVLVYPNTPAKQKDYQELMVKTFYLANADAPKIVTMLKTVLKTRDVYADEKLNSVTVRDTPAAIRLVEHLIAAQDLPEPEVTLEVEVLEVSRSRLAQLGVNPPAQFTLLNIVPSPTQTVAANGTVVTNNNPVTTTSQLTVDNLRHINGSNIGIPNPQVDIHAELGNTDLLANPRIRVRNREKAHILIGDKVPVITTTSTANVGVSENVSYLDVGLKLDVEPTVYLNDDVGIKVGLEVSSIVKQITTQSGTLTYQIGTRAATTELRLHDGETQALAGLINDQERHSAQGVPGLIDLPIINRLFSTGNDQHDKTEIVLLITPHIVRNIAYSQDTPLEYSAGTETNSGAEPLRLRNQSSVSAPPLGQPTQEGASASTPQSVQEPEPKATTPPAEPRTPVPPESPAQPIIPAAPASVRETPTQDAPAGTAGVPANR